MKIIQLGNFDWIKAVANYQSQISNFNISGFIIFNLNFALGIYCHFYLFNWIFNQQLSPCFGGDTSTWYTSTTNFFLNSQIVTLLINIVLDSYFSTTRIRDDTIVVKFYWFALS